MSRVRFKLRRVQGNCEACDLHLRVSRGSPRVKHPRAIGKALSCKRRDNLVLKTKQLPTRIFNTRSNQRDTTDRGLFMLVLRHPSRVTCKFANRDRSRTESQRVSISCFSQLTTRIFNINVPVTTNRKLDDFR